MVMMAHEITGQCSSCYRHAYETVGGMCKGCIADEIGRKTDLEVCSPEQWTLFEPALVCEIVSSVSHAEALVQELQEDIDSHLDDLRADIDLGETIDKIPARLVYMGNALTGKFKRIERELKEALDGLETE